MIFNYLIVFVLAAVMVFVVLRVVARYTAATGTVWQRLLATSEQSAVILWQYVLILGGAFCSGLGFLAETFNLPEVKASIQTYLKPEWAGIVLIAITVITIWARMRTLGKES